MKLLNRIKLFFKPYKVGDVLIDTHGDKLETWEVEDRYILVIEQIGVHSALLRRYDNINNYKNDSTYIMVERTLDDLIEDTIKYV